MRSPCYKVTLLLIQGNPVSPFFLRRFCNIISPLAVLLLLSTAASAAENQWTWIKGHNDPTTTGVYGELGIPSENNTPRGSGFPAQWTTPDGNTWLYGGAGNYNTMWKFDHATSNWAWMSGTSTPLFSQPVYGTKGIEAPGNHPGSRIKMISWADAAGNLWLYGGVGDGSHFYADLWKFNTQSLQWAWVHGSDQNLQAAVYGVKGESAPDNYPGARYGSSAWVDDDGNFWLFGGHGQSSEWGWLNDLWKYNVSTGQWAWVGGTQTPMAPPNYGTRGVPSMDNIPGGRSDSAAWRDSDGNFWLFGGFGKTIHTGETTTATVGRLNDVWKYQPSTGLWTWLSGSKLVNQPSVFGMRGVPHSDNQPGSRINMRATVDKLNQVWILGGTGGSNDLWCYSMPRNLWVWVHGNLSENPYGIYGTRGIAAPENTPGARFGHATWLDPQGNLMLFGGYESFGATSRGHLNDLWTLTPGHFNIPAAAESWHYYE